MLDPDGVVTSWNPGARRFKGYEPAEIIGKHFLHVLCRRRS
ncbi:MAG: PAS domain-containing protein [Aliidongia sp.]